MTVAAVCVCVCVCVRACVRACVCACVYVCVCARARMYTHAGTFIKKDTCECKFVAIIATFLSFDNVFDV